MNINFIPVECPIQVDGPRNPTRQIIASRPSKRIDIFINVQGLHGFLEPRALQHLTSFGQGAKAKAPVTGHCGLG